MSSIQKEMLVDRRDPTDREAEENVLVARVGNREGVSFRVKPPLTDVRRIAGNVVEGRIRWFERACVISGSKGKYRFFELMPGNGENSIEFAGFHIRGRFDIVGKINNPRKAREAFKAFR